MRKVHHALLLNFHQPPGNLDDLLAKLRSMTNIRVVGDPDAATGWKVEIGPFPGWAEVPTW